jgi:hypothetical protein
MARLGNELEGRFKEATVAYFKALHWYICLEALRINAEVII